jgi:hypothetical protein
MRTGGVELDRAVGLGVFLVPVVMRRFACLSDWPFARLLPAITVLAARRTAPACASCEPGPGQAAGCRQYRHGPSMPNSSFRVDFPPPPSLPAPAGRDYAMTTPNTEIGAIALHTMRAKLEEAAAVARAAEGLAADGRPGRGLMMALDVEPLAIEANSLLQGLAILSRVAREEQDDARS